MTTKSEQRHIDIIVAQQLDFLHGKLPTDPWSGGDTIARPPIQGARPGLLPMVLNSFLCTYATKLTTEQKEEAAGALARAFTEPGMRQRLVRAHALGLCLAQVKNSLGLNGTVWGREGLLDIERMRETSTLVTDLRALGQIAQACPEGLGYALGDPAHQGAVARNALIFLFRQTDDLRKKKEKSPHPLEHPQKLKDIAQCLSGLLSYCSAEDWEAWLNPACAVAGHLHFHGIEIPATTIAHPLDQVSSQDPLIQQGLVELRRAGLKQYIEEYSARPEKSNHKRNI